MKAKTRPESTPTAEKESASRVFYLVTDVTKNQKRAILAHCTNHQVSVSRFLSGLAVADALKASSQLDGNQEEVTFTIKLRPEKHAKLKIFSQRQGKSIDETLQDLVTSYLEKKQTPSNLKLETLRFYLSPEEHELVMRSLQKRGLSSRNYIGLLALDALRNER